MKYEIVFTCEHASCALPEERAAHFGGAGGIVRSHRGWDPGARHLARLCARHMNSSLFCGRYSRLLIDLNRSLDNPEIWSEWTAGLSDGEKQKLVKSVWNPFRTAVRDQVRQSIQAVGRCLHVSVHTFTPLKDGVKRTTDIGILFDPDREQEAAQAQRMIGFLKKNCAFAVDANLPYHGCEDGHTTALRQQFADAQYAGIEWELNQRLLRPGGRFPGKLSGLLLQAITA